MTVTTTELVRPTPGEPHGSPGRSSVRLEVEAVDRRFNDTWALRDVSLRLRAGRIHALLGPNGAGKTTLLRIVAGLTGPTSGSVSFHTASGTVPGGWDARHLVGLVPTGDRSFYLRLSGLQNLEFFGRLYGFSRREARGRAVDRLDRVGLAAAGSRRVGLYSQGMKKRLAVARALMASPPVLLVDEATHDLDPEGARTVRALVADAAAAGAAVLWATQRLEEIRGFADGVTLLQDGAVRFAGTVDQLIAGAEAMRYVVRLRGAQSRALKEILGGAASIEPVRGDADHWVLHLAGGGVLGAAVARLDAAGIDVLSCHRERSEVEDAFMALTGGDA
jgi:ABC-type multidrug transport system ATPase subunit